MMKTIINILIVLLSTLGIAKAHTNDNKLLSDVFSDSIVYKTVYVYDTVYIQTPLITKNQNTSNDFIKTKAIGRYDRGISNYKFIPKKKWIGGITVSYLDFDSKDSRLLYSLFKDIDSHARTLSVKPFIGYAFKDNSVIGLKFGYNHTIAELGNLSLNIDDIDVSMKDMRYSEEGYTVALFHRAYVGIDAGRRFGLFNDITLAFNMASSSFMRDKGDTAQRIDNNIYELHLGVNPGIAVFIMDNVSAEMSFGVAGFKYRSESQKNHLGETGKRNSSGANFKINLFNINIGITVCL